MKRIIYTQDNGVVAVIIPSLDWKGTLTQLAKCVVPKGIAYKIVEASTIPEDRTFREAWELAEKTVKVNMDKARNIHMAAIKRARNKKLADLDIEQLKGNDVATQKQKLRDLPIVLDLSIAETPDDLKIIWPEELN